MRLLVRSFLGLLILYFCLPVQTRAVEFQVGVSTNLTVDHFTGRLLLFVSDTKPSMENGKQVVSGNLFFTVGADIDDFGNGKTVVVKPDAARYFFSQATNLSDGHYFVWGTLYPSAPIYFPETRSNFLISVQEVDINSTQTNAVKIWLDKPGVPEPSIPQDTQFVKFLQVHSDLLTKFHGHPMDLRCGIVLPRDYYQHPDRSYPIWIRIGGYGARYWSIKSFMDEKSDFRKTWDEADTPRMILVQLDGAGPYGDPYQVNSANNGPYGDALIQELIPEVEKKFRSLPHCKVLSGVSTGGWVSLALQIFYPDEFEGVWSSCPDPVDFRAFELINIYKDTNAYVNAYGFERPSERTVEGDVKLTMRRELQLENVCGRGDSWAMSGQQWCAWNAVYSLRGKDGFPEPLWDPKTGAIDRSVAEAWKRYDLHLYLQEHWKTLAPKLRGKLHIAAAEGDNYYLNNAVHLLDDFLSHADPPFKGSIIYGPQKGHGWSNLSLKQMLQEMQASVDQKTNAMPLP